MATKEKEDFCQPSCLLVKLLSSLTASALCGTPGLCLRTTVVSGWLSLSFCRQSSRHWGSLWAPPCWIWRTHSTSDSLVSFCAETYFDLQVLFVEKWILAWDIFCLRSVNSKKSFALEFLFFKKNSQDSFCVAVPQVSLSTSKEQLVFGSCSYEK